jgi:hypothetical protein
MTMRYVLAAAAFLVTLGAVAVTTLLIVIVLAGPHSDILPMPLQILLYLLAWAAVLVVPVLAARAAWRYTGGGNAR